MPHLPKDFGYTAAPLRCAASRFATLQTHSPEPRVARKVDGSLFDAELVAKRIEALLDAGMKWPAEAAPRR